MKKLVLSLLVAACALVACNREKEYVVSGSFNIPEQLQFGDTTIARGPLDGIQVFLFDLGGNVVDSTVVENETFTFKGKVSEKNAWFGTILCDYCMGLLVIEPGNIDVVLTNDVEATGTPMNDQIAEIVEGLSQLESDVYNKMYEIYAANDPTVEADEEKQMQLIMPIYEESMERRNALLDSFYVNNKENLVGVFAASALTESASTSDELEEMLSEYSEFVQKNEWMQYRLDYMRRAEAEGPKSDHERFLEDFGDVLNSENE